MKDIFKILTKEFNAKQRKNYIDIAIPVVMWTSGGLLDLRIRKREGGYVITSLSNIFLEANQTNDAEFYYRIFNKHDKMYHFDMKLKNGKVYKEYSEDQNIVIAINEFIRYFIMLDDFIINNKVIGQEENF